MGLISVASQRSSCLLFCQYTGGPSSLQERGRDSCLRAVLCYKRLFIRVCMGCKRFFLKERKNVYVFKWNRLTLLLCCVLCCLPTSQAVLKCFRRVNTSLLSSKSHVRVPLVSLGHLCVIPQILNLFTAVFIVYLIISKIVSRTFIRIITASCFSYSYS